MILGANEIQRRSQKVVSRILCGYGCPARTLQCWRLAGRVRGEMTATFVLIRAGQAGPSQEL